MDRNGMTILKRKIREHILATRIPFNLLGICFRGLLLCRWGYGRICHAKTRQEFCAFSVEWNLNGFISI
jgi:hypothetical protein